MKLSLRARLLAATLTLVTAALVTAGLAYYFAAERLIRQTIAADLALRATETLEDGVRRQAAAAHLVDTWANADAIQLTLDNGDPKFAEDYLRRSLHADHDSFEWAALLDGNHRVAATTGSDRHGDLLRWTRGGQLTLPVVKAARGEGPVLGLESRGPGRPAALLVACPVRDFTGGQVGTLAVSLSDEGMSGFLAALAGGAPGPYLPLFFDAEGLRVLTVAGQSLPLVSSTVWSSLEGRQAILVGGVVHLVGRASSPASERPRWSAVVLVPEEAALGELRGLRRLMAAMFLLTLVLTCVTGVWVTRRAARPLSELAISMGRVAGGDLAVRLPDVGAGELGQVAKSFNTMVTEVARAQEKLQRAESLKRELEIARKIQTSILPRGVELEGFELAARMRPVEEVGGDFYDVLQRGDGFWLVMGDVSGHGLNAGLVMLMAQAALHAAIAARPGAAPSEVLTEVNRMLHENVHNRMGSDDYLTLVVVRHCGAGRFIAAGSHQAVFITGVDGAVRVVEPGGPWCGIVGEIGNQLVDTEFRVEPGESLWLMTDGLAEAADASGELFGEDRVVSGMSGAAQGSAAEAVSSLFGVIDAFAQRQRDDMTLLVLRRACSREEGITRSAG